MATIAERINKAKQDNSKANGNKPPALSIEERIRMAKQDSGKAGTRGTQGSTVATQSKEDLITYGTRLKTTQGAINDFYSRYGATGEDISDKMFSYHGASKGKDGTYTFGTQEDMDAFKAAQTELFGLYDSYNADLAGYNKLYERDYTVDGIRGRVEELKAEREKLEMQRQQAQRLAVGAARSRGLGGGTGNYQEEINSLSQKINEINAELDVYGERYYDLHQQEQQEALKNNSTALMWYTNAKELQADVDKIWLVNNDIVAHNPDDPRPISEEAIEAQKYLEQKYGITDDTLMQVRRELEKRQNVLKGSLAGNGFDYDEMVQYEQRLKDKEEAAAKKAEWEEYAQKHWILSSLETILYSPLQGVDYLTMALGNIGHNDPSDLDSYVPFDTSNMDITNFVSTVRGTVSEGFGDETFWDKAQSFLYNTGMSIADSGTTIAALGPASVVVMGMSAASNQAKSVIERGGTNGQALWSGLAAGAAELILEKIGVDNLLAPKNVVDWKSLLKETFKQGGIEATEEMLTEVSNILTDTAIMAEKSDYALAVQIYMAEQGMSEEEAKFKAFLDCIGQIGLAGAGGFISGNVMGGISSAVQYNGNKKAFAETGNDYQIVAKELIEEGLSRPKNSEAYKLAEQLQKKQVNGRTISDTELGRLVYENEQEVQKKNAGSGMETTAVDTNPATHTPEENRTIEAFRDAVDENILSFYQAAVRGENPKSFALKPVSNRAAEDIKRLVGRDVSGFGTQFDARQAEHIYDDHGENGKSDHSMADPNDVARIQYVLDNYDVATDGGQTDAYWEPKENGRNRQAKTVVFAKKVNGTYYVVEAVPVTKARKVNIVSAYMLESGKTPPGRGKKIEGNSQLPDASAPWFTAETDSATNPSITDTTIPQPANSVNFGTEVAFGEKGMQVVAEIAADNGLTVEQAQGVVRLAYQTGRANLPGTQLDLTDANQQRAYNAGQMDYIAENSNGKDRAVQVAQDAGLVRDKMLEKANLSSKDRRMLDAVGKAVGVKVRFVDKLTDKDGRPANAQYGNGELLIALNAADPVRVAFTHEIVHRMREVSPEAYNALATFVQRNMSSDSMAVVQRAYSAAYGTNPDVLSEEIVAQAVGQMMSDSAVMERFVKDNRNAGQKLLDAVHDLIAAIKRVLNGQNVKLTAEQKADFAELQGRVEEMAKTLESALKQMETDVQRNTGAGNKNTASKGGEVKYALKGHTKDGRPVYETDFEADVPIEERIKIFKDRIETVFNLGAVTLKIDVKKIVVNGDKFTAQKNVYGDLARENGTTEFEAKINALYDMVDILEGAKFVPPANREPSYGTNVPPKNKAHKDVKYWYKFRTNIVFDGVGYEVTFNIRDKGKNGQYAYLVEFKKDGTTSASNTAVSGLLRSTPSPHKIRITQNGAKYNPQNLESKNAASVGGEVKYSLNRRFAAELDAWDGAEDKTFSVGRTSEALQSIGVQEKGIIWRGRKIGEILRKHPGMTRDIIKQVPEVLEHPVVVLKSQKNDSRIVVFGELADENGAPVTAILELAPASRGGELLDMNVVASAYGKNSDPAGFVQRSDLLYLDPDKNRTKSWMQGLGLQLPSDATALGSIGTITYQDGKVKIIGVPYKQYMTNAANNALQGDSKNSLVVARSKAAETLRQELAGIRENGAQTGKDAAEIELEVQQAIERSYESLVDEYGAIPAGENPARDVQVPKRTADNQKVSQTVRTILEAKATPDVAIPTIEELTATGDFSYEVYTDKQAMADADNTIRDKGYNTALMDWTKSVQEGEVSKSNTALGWALYNQAANAGDLKTAMSILTNMVGHQRNAAQAVQATRILKKMSPEAQLYGVQRSAQNLAEELKKRYGKDAPDIQVNEELARKYLEAETDKEREEAMRNLYRDLGRQMPSRFIDKWNAWRYLAMLGNPRTHVRNVLGNAFFAPVVLAKDMTALAIEEVVYRVSGGKLERTKGAVGFGKQGRELLSAAWSDYESVADQVSSGGKYSDLDHSNQYIQEGRRIFKNRVLEAARKGNSAALEAEDMWFSRPHYAYALAQYCKAHGITPEMLRAANEGQKNTATRGGEARYSVKGNPYVGKSMATDSSVYTYDFLASLEDMHVVEMPPLSDVKIDGIVDRDWVAKLGTENAAKEGRAISDTVSAVVNRYTGREIRVSRNGLLHSLGAENINRLRTNARLSAIGGTIVKNAVPINALKDTNPQAKGTYAMVCLLKSGEKDVVAVVTVEQHTSDVTQLDFVDVTHAISGRLDKQKGDRWSSTRETGLNPATTISTISISDLLEIVKTTYQSILSDDVLARFGEQRNPQGYYADKVKFSLKTENRPAAATAPHVDRILLDRARAYAIKEAQKATYRDTNAFSQTISELGRYRGNNKVKKGVGVALEGILPFRKTPANILVRGLEYSPAGFLKGLFWDVWQIKSGKKTAAEVIDHISAGLTGSGLLALGAFLAAQGLVRGAGGDDEEKKEFEALQGHQTYAMELPGGTSVTLDWLAPEALPFFVGVNLWEQKAGNKDGGVTLSDILTATANVTEPLLELSCLQSLNDVFDAVGYAASDGLPALPSALASAATSYLTQGFPTILGQAERTGEDKRMSTYTEKNAFLTPDIQYTLGRISARLPGVDYQQIPYIDAWGRTENTGTGVERAGNNFLNPAYTSTVETSPMEDELLRLYEQTGEGSVLPSRAAKYFNVDGERKDLTAQEYVKYAQVKGQTAYKVLTALTGSQAYRKMSDAEKAEAVGLVYDYANATAKTKVSAYKPDGWIAKAVKTEKAAGVKAEQCVTLYLAQKDIESLKDADGDTIANSKSLLVMEMVYDVKGLTDAQRRALFEDFGVGKSVIHYNKTLVQVKLNEMRRKAG